MEFNKLSHDIDRLLLRLKVLEKQVDDMKKREANLLAANKNLQLQIEQAQAKIQQTIGRLKIVEEQA